MDLKNKVALVTGGGGDIVATNLRSNTEAARPDKLIADHALILQSMQQSAELGYCELPLCSSAMHS